MPYQVGTENVVICRKKYTSFLKCALFQKDESIVRQRLGGGHGAWHTRD